MNLKCLFRHKWRLHAVSSFGEVVLYVCERCKKIKEIHTKEI